MSEHPSTPPEPSTPARPPSAPVVALALVCGWVTLLHPEFKDAVDVVILVLAAFNPERRRKR